LPSELDSESVNASSEEEPTIEEEIEYPPSKHPDFYSGYSERAVKRAMRIHLKYMTKQAALAAQQQQTIPVLQLTGHPGNPQPECTDTAAYVTHIPASSSVGPDQISLAGPAGIISAGTPVNPQSIALVEPTVPNLTVGTSLPVGGRRRRKEKGSSSTPLRTPLTEIVEETSSEAEEAWTEVAKPDVEMESEQESEQEEKNQTEIAMHYLTKMYTELMVDQQMKPEEAYNTMLQTMQNDAQLRMFHMWDHRGRQV